MNKKNTEVIKLGHEVLDKIRDAVTLLEKAASSAEQSGEPALANSFRHYRRQLEHLIISDNAEAGLWVLVGKL